MIKIYKKGEGKIVRTCALIAALALLFYGCCSLYDIPHTESWLYRTLTVIPVLNIVIRNMFLICAPIFVGLGLLIFWYLNRPQVADFLIETEGELRKVSWPPRKEYITSSGAVLVLIVIIAIFLYLTDKGLSFMLRKIGIGF
jgi:preprotein translocase subunit SecE